MKRSKIKREDCELVAFWLPKDVCRLLDAVVDQEDTDRSKFLRGALRDKLNLRLEAAK